MLSSKNEFIHSIQHYQKKTAFDSPIRMKKGFIILDKTLKSGHSGVAGREGCCQIIALRWLVVIIRGSPTRFHWRFSHGLRCRRASHNESKFIMMSHLHFHIGNIGILFPKLFWPNVRKKTVLVIKTIFWNLRLKAENLKNLWDHKNNFWNRMRFKLVPEGFSDLIH